MVKTNSLFLENGFSRLKTPEIPPCDHYSLNLYYPSED